MKESAIRLHGGAPLGGSSSFLWVWRRPLDWPDDLQWSPDTDGEFPRDVYGMVLHHPSARSELQCMTMIYVKEPYDHTSGMIWKVLEWEPLTLEKAIECTTCGAIGMVEGGAWRPLVSSPD